VSGSTTSTSTKGRIYHKMYGCQMNISDMEIVLSIMKNEGYNEIVPDPESADNIYQHL
jgi:tRNA A37 methylthiotransferase MiaB